MPFIIIIIIVLYQSLHLNSFQLFNLHAISVNPPSDHKQIFVLFAFRIDNPYTFFVSVDCFATN